VTTQTYHEASLLLLTQAESELAQGDVRQASEKAWGAAAQIVKAVAQQRGWPHQSHASLYCVVGQLTAETHDEDIRRFFGIANALHTNFYEDWLTDGMVARGIDDVRELISRLENRTEPPLNPRPSQARRPIR